MAALPASLSARSFLLTPACPGQYIHRSFRRWMSTIDACWILIPLILMTDVFAQNAYTIFTTSADMTLANNTSSNYNTVLHLVTDTLTQNATITSSESVNFANRSLTNNTPAHYSTVQLLTKTLTQNVTTTTISTSSAGVDLPNTPAHFNTYVQDASQLGLALLTDKYGNKADRDSLISYANFNKTASYGARFWELDEGMTPFYHLAKAIAGGAFAFGDYPFRMMKSATRRRLDGDMPSVPVPRYLHGYLVSVGLGLFLALGLMVVFLVFCCCLCTGHCRPTRLLAYSYISHFHLARVHVEQTLPAVRCASLAAGTLILVGVMGIVTAAQTNRHLSKALHQLGTNAERILSDIVTFADHAEEDVLSVFPKLDFAKMVFFRDLDKIGQLMGGSIRDELQTRTGVVDATEDLRAFEAITCLTYESLRRLNDHLEEFNRNVEELKTAVNDVKRKCAAMPKCEPVFLMMAVPHINVSGPLSALQNVNDRGFSSYIDTAAAELHRIIEETTKNGKATSEKLKENLASEMRKVNEYRSIVTHIKVEFIDKLKLNEMRKMVFEIRNLTADVDHHRNLVTLSALVFQAVPVLVLLSGVVLAPIAMKMFDDDSMQRPRFSRRRPTFCEIRCVGVYLLCGSFLFIMLSWVWMSVAVVFFAVGAPLEGLLCSPLFDPRWTVVDTLVEEYSLLGQHGNATWLAHEVGMPETNITIGSVVRACRDHQTVYTAFQLHKKTRTNLSRRLDFEKDLNISGLLEAIPVQIHPFDVLVDEVMAYLADLSDATDAIPLKELEGVLQMNITGPTKSLRPGLPPLLRQFLDPAVDAKVDRLQVALGQDLRELKHLVQAGGRSMRERANTAVAVTREAQRKIPIVSQRAVAKGTKTFEKRLAGIVNSVVMEVLNNVEKEAGSCRPLYDMLDALILGDLCTNVNNVLNGLWLSLGWLNLFLLPAVALCVWLYRQVYKLPPPPPSPPLPVLPEATLSEVPAWWLHRTEYREEILERRIIGDGAAMKENTRL